VLAACPQLRIVANMAVGYNNFDVDAMTAAGVLGTNAPDVLTETTADFGFALLMATARRVTESEHFLRAGLWTNGATTCSPARSPRQHAGHPGHGPHRPGHCQARRARLSA
jgi:lactate dehydrogenase-like 2-hydroxyacid dehydrogenase